MKRVMYNVKTNETIKEFKTHDESEKYIDTFIDCKLVDNEYKFYLGNTEVNFKIVSDLF